MKLSVVVPIYNEEKTIPQMHQRLSAVLQGMETDWEIIFVDDGSKDNSLDMLKSLALADPKIHYTSFSRNFGHQMAVWAGLERCTGDAIVIIDGDLQDPPELIPELVEKHKEGFRIVYAQRRSRKGDGFFKRLTAKMFYRGMRKMTKVDIPVDTGDFRLIDRKVLDALKAMPESHKFLRGQIAWTGFRQTSVLFDRDKRAAGKTGYSIGKMVNLALDGVTGFSSTPIRFVTMVGFLVFLFSFLMIIYALLAKIFKEDIMDGWTSLMIVIAFLGGIQLMSLGVIGEYISRISSDVRRRPLYMVEETDEEEKATSTEAESDEN